MDLIERIGVDVGRRLKLEDAIDWAAANGVRYIDIQLDTGANAVNTFDDARARAIRAALEKHGIHLGLHTLSAVNVAEYSPFLSEAVDAYMKAYIDAAPRLGAESIVVHAGYHFTADVKMRMQAGLERLKRMVAYAETKGALLLLENLNKEPADAEVHYLAHTIEEWRSYYEAIDSPAFALSFTANHAHLLPEGVEGFVAAIPMHRVVEVRLADCFRNGHEQHLVPGEGDFDFGAMFKLIEGTGFKGHYMNAFGTLEDMQHARARLVDLARAAGVSA
ncbi:sugar phosphate isomerase/epimerase family protein [Elioraea tepidiphila]|jgi:sugar phosphate isomerase/epimerase|uniref:sugar phosphate isomerase/epimerase family protein n=1 Tax=Elioraea tepidiphila TaxID=457934 RepID=UPI000363AFD3|nr:TIM barrel protein [Elioraea tepidiphila]